MSEYLTNLVENAKANGYVVAVYPRKKRININGRGMYTYSEATARLAEMLKVR